MTDARDPQLPAAATTLVVRRADARDLPALGRLGAMLMRAHYAFDGQRFLAPQQGDDVAVFVAERDGRVVGYVYAGIEPRSWKELRDVAGFIHDVVVDEAERGAGIATRRLTTAVARAAVDSGETEAL